LIRAVYRKEVVLVNVRRAGTGLECSHISGLLGPRERCTV
jgi:hypothetical protein